MTAPILLGIICLTLLGFGLLMLRKSRDQAASEQVLQRLLADQPEPLQAAAINAASVIGHVDTKRREQHVDDGD